MPPTLLDKKPVEILLVEDSPGDVRLTREAFREARVPNNLHVTTDGEQAIAFLHRDEPFTTSPRPDLILLDLNLPRKSGREVLKEIKADPAYRRIPIVVLTTSQSHEDIAAVYDLAGNCYIAKPVDLERFLEVVRIIEDFWLTTVQLPGTNA
ncbi:MAG: response regulator [Verrucomicrobiales bacterium]|nr:response regulator [Verrucomicrobiales bacterium]